VTKTGLFPGLLLAALANRPSGVPPLTWGARSSRADRAAATIRGRRWWWPLGLALVLSNAAAQAGPPYPAGNLQITFDLNSYRAGGSGGDIWPVTQRGNGALIAAWGDGAIGTCPKVSYGVARIGSGAPNDPGPAGGPCGQEHQQDRGDRVRLADSGSGVAGRWDSRGRA
jgi:hypothetical protein